MKILKFNEMHNITGSRIKDLRIQRGLTQEQLAAQMQTAGIQINQKAISRIESGDRIITDYELLRLAEILHVSVNQLLNESLYNPFRNDPYFLSDDPAPCLVF